MQACARIASLSTVSLVAAGTTPASSLQSQFTVRCTAASHKQTVDSCSLLGKRFSQLKDAELKSPIPAQSRRVIRAATGESATTSTVDPLPTGEAANVKILKDRVIHITTVEEFDEALQAANNKLVVVEYAATHSANSRRIYPSMVELSKSCQDVIFLLVLGDETDANKELCRRAGVESVPHFVFYKNSEKIHEETGISPDTLLGDVLYYGDNDAPIHQVRNKVDFDSLLRDHASDDKLVVLDVGLKSCGPCVKVYPTVVKLSRQMAGNTVFARMHGDENEDCMQLLRNMGVVEVPTFLFIRDGKPLGRYVGSGKGELIGEILRYNGVRVT